MDSDTTLSGFVDSHFHTREMAKKGLHVSEELKAAMSFGMAAGIDVAVDLQDIATRAEQTKAYPTIGTTLGLAPHEAERPDIKPLLADLEGLLVTTAPMAVGEIGLDWHWNYGTPDRQIELFESQLALADKTNLPVVIHNRLADADMVEILSKNAPSRGGIMHCFSSDYATALRFVEMGFLISFAGNVTYKRSDKIQETAAGLPLESILCETDSPYLSPLPVRGTVNTPSNVRYIYSFLAKLRNEPIERVVEQVGLNYHRLFDRHI